MCQSYYKVGLQCWLLYTGLFGTSGEHELDPAAERRPGERLLHSDVPEVAARRGRAGPRGAHKRVAAHHLGLGPAQL